MARALSIGRNSQRLTAVIKHIRQCKCALPGIGIGVTIGRGILRVLRVVSSTFRDRTLITVCGPRPKRKIVRPPYKVLYARHGVKFVKTRCTLCLLKPIRNVQSPSEPGIGLYRLMAFMMSLIPRKLLTFTLPRLYIGLGRVIRPPLLATGPVSVRPDLGPIKSGRTRRNTNFPPYAVSPRPLWARLLRRNGVLTSVNKVLTPRGTIG